MRVKIFYIEDQANGNLNKGEILEKNVVTISINPTIINVLAKSILIIF